MNYSASFAMEISKFLVLAGGHITCLRCTAMSKHTRLQCAKPALKISRTQKCGHHGGGPKSRKQSAEGRVRIGAVHRVHGRETNQVRQERSQGALRMAQLEDICHAIGLITTAPRSSGRKPVGYKPIRSMEDVRKWVIEDALQQVEAVTDEG